MVNKGIMEEKGLYATYKNVFSQLDKVRGNQELLNNGINHLKSMLKLQIVTEVVSFHSSSDIENMTQFLENTKREIKRKLEFKYDKYFEWEYFEEPQPKLGVLKEDFQKRRDIAYEEHVSEESERKKLFDKEKEEAKASFENTDEYKVFSEALKKLDECLECLSPGKIKNFTKEMFSEELIDKKRYTKIIETCANNMILEKNGIFASEEVNGKPIFVYDEKGNLKIDVDTFVEFSHAINSTKHNSNRINETKEKIDEEKAHLAENSEKIEQLEKQRPLVDAINQEKTNIKDLITKINAKKSSEDIYNVNEKIFYVKNNIEIIEKLEELDELLQKEGKKWFKDKSEIERLRKIVQNNKSKLEMINAENLDIGSIKKENEHLYSEAHSILEKINIEKKVELVGKVLGNEITNEQLEEIKKVGYRNKY